MSDLDIITELGQQLNETEARAAELRAQLRQAVILCYELGAIEGQQPTKYRIAKAAQQPEATVGRWINQATQG